MVRVAAAPSRGEVAAARCDGCRRAKEARYSGVTGWFTDDDGNYHNHLGRSKEAERAALRGTPAAANRQSANPAPTRLSEPKKAGDIQLTVDEVSIAAQMGVPLENLRRQKLKDRTVELQGRITALDLVDRFREE